MRNAHENKRCGCGAVVPACWTCCGSCAASRRAQAVALAGPPLAGPPGKYRFGSDERREFTAAIKTVKGTIGSTQDEAHQLYPEFYRVIDRESQSAYVEHVKREVDLTFEKISANEAFRERAEQERAEELAAELMRLDNRECWVVAVETWQHHHDLCDRIGRLLQNPSLVFRGDRIVNERGGYLLFVSRSGGIGEQLRGRHIVGGDAPRYIIRPRNRELKYHAEHAEQRENQAMDSLSAEPQTMNQLAGHSSANEAFRELERLRQEAARRAEHDKAAVYRELKYQAEYAERYRQEKQAEAGRARKEQEAQRGALGLKPTPNPPGPSRDAREALLRLEAGAEPAWSWDDATGSLSLQFPDGARFELGYVELAMLTSEEKIELEALVKAVRRPPEPSKRLGFEPHPNPRKF